MAGIMIRLAPALAQVLTFLSTVNRFPPSLHTLHAINDLAA